ncbi:cytochrome-c peroxidase [Pseudobacteriovorax antillogorgiicola]|uniref:Cytochrome c peroxidase n=1 Tax=Pseudobacteriovorax antillogorgiicola TaxID=1513793 RepID=A0A1Y6CRE5_9BACT|nr:cytochrome c peroxidase [Pseudobacteriovorax antillogorgiicola]TCS42110.1 cytochrome c peroxidase [Pseudobacteriovorax antillogorgiicola]SMF83076.1 cytochrome c peroxidase [Pseudobacteriovorax antillogorgiicola]
MKSIKQFFVLAPLLSLEFSCGIVEELQEEEGSVLLETTEISADVSLTLPEESYDYAFTFGGMRLAEQDNTPSDNPITDAGATLGRVLFYDTLLSLNETVSCGTCHIQSLGFADNLALSVGFDGELTGRNSMGLANARFYENGKFFWDERADSLEEQVLMPIQDSKEMGLSIDEAVLRVSEASYYASLFEAAFGDSTVTEERMSYALAQFVRSIAGFPAEALTDRRATGDLDSEVLAGKRLFFSREASCGRCHGGASLTTDQARDNGLEIFDDLGVFTATGDSDDIGEFKVPSLVNIGLTAPYMHDGRFETLREVVEHYSSGIQENDNLSNRIAENLTLSDGESDSLVAYLESLTNTNLTTNPKWSDPFVRQ